jgi:hypothetical protein
MKLGSLIIGVILTAIALSMMFYPISLKITAGVIVGVGAFLTILGAGKRKESTYASDDSGYGRTTFSGRKIGSIFLGIILLLIGFNLMLSFFTFSLMGYDINALVLLAFGVIGLVNGLRRNVGRGSKAHRGYLSKKKEFLAMKRAAPA